MARFECSICKAANDPLTAEAACIVNEELSKRRFERKTLRELESASHFSRSALDRHRRRCLPLLRLHEHGRKKSAALESTREIVAMKQPSGNFLLFLNGQPFDPASFRNHQDDLLIVRFENGPAHPDNQQKSSDEIPAEETAPQIAPPAL